MTKGFLITCAIDYPNASLHMGHVYEKTLADVIARIHRLNGEKVLFSVGVDEHGEKVQKAAETAHLSPQEYADKMAAEFQSLFDKTLISYDTFVRTTQPSHVASAQYFFSKLWEGGDIYPDTYEGWYCVSDETFWTEKDLVEMDGKKVCPNDHCHKPVEKVKEPSYFFKWSRFQEKLEQWYASEKNNVFPPFRKNEMEHFLKNGLKDISFSRKNISWGIPVPQDESHTMYVWSDALVNYLTVCGYPSENYLDYWPADIHVIGMDINRFHSLLWPAMLMSAGIALPKQVLVHGFVNDESGKKMSKSVGNVVNPLEIIDKYGIEPLRYYLLRETPLGNDLSFLEKNLIERNNAELADGLGNLVYRVLSMLEKYTNGIIPAATLDASLLEKMNTLCGETYQLYLSHSLPEALSHVFRLVDEGNRFIAQQEPWKKMKEGKRDEVETLLATEVELLRRLSILIQPVLPQSSASICTQFGFPAPSFNQLQNPVSLAGKKTTKGAVLFTKREWSDAP